MRAPGHSGQWIGGAILLLLLLLPIAVSGSNLQLPTEVFLFALFALTYDLLFGFTGLISFGHALFVGAGGYTLAIAMTGHGAPLWQAFLAALIVGMVLSLVTGSLALRTRGVYFAMVTLAFAQAAFTLTESNLGNMTGGENGLQVSGAPAWLTGPGNGTHFYYVALAVLVAGFLLLHLFVNSPAGRIWQAIRENEQRALMLGINPYAFKLLSYTIAGTIASLAGAVYALFVGAVSINLYSSDTTIQLLLMVIIGGAGRLWGAILGAAIVRYLDYYLNVLSTASWVTNLPDWLHATLGQPLLIFGCIYLLLVYFFPQGIAGLMQTRLRLFRSAAAAPGLAEIEPEIQRGEDLTPVTPAEHPGG